MGDAKKKDPVLKPQDQHATGTEDAALTTQDQHATGGEIGTLDQHATSEPFKPGT
ncbi:sigma-like protein [Streptomyces sp. NPDC006923]|uniref:sigma-like protein n=1 Tax=Streptomyces sp. NPDC006923 TaxID=3155355 RepID=UPI0033D62BC2